MRGGGRGGGEREEDGSIMGPRVGMFFLLWSANYSTKVIICCCCGGTVNNKVVIASARELHPDD